MQTADGGDANISQGADAENIAGTLANADQANAATNTDTIAQAASGPGQGSQSAGISAAADATAGQNVDAGSSNGAIVAQGAVGETGNIDQSAWLGQAAATEVDADQDNLAYNTDLISQACGTNVFGGGGSEGQCGQEAWVDADAHAQADQDIAAGSANDTLILQAAESTGDHKNGGNVAQNADAENGAITDVLASQLNVAGNDNDVSQAAGGVGQTAQGADVASSANAGAGQSVDADSANATGIGQLATTEGDNVDQNAYAGSEAVTGVGVGQENAGVNETDIAQATDAEQASQEAWAGLWADAQANQAADADSSNDTIIDQAATAGSDDKGGANIAQDADVSNAADTDLLAGQSNTAFNGLNIGQASTGDGQAAQSADGELDAIAAADQDVSGNSDNTTVVVQDADSDGSGNFDQDAWVGNDAATAVGAEQENAAANVAVVDQDADGGQAFQSAWLGLLADADADQDVDGDSSNDTEITQTETGASGNFSQAADVENASNTEVGADQANTAFNGVDVDQDCDAPPSLHGGKDPSAACQQDADVAAAADADAVQNVSGTSGNSTTVTQNAEGTDDEHKNGNNSAQDAWVGNAADTSVGAEQEKCCRQRS